MKFRIFLNPINLKLFDGNYKKPITIATGFRFIQDTHEKWSFDNRRTFFEGWNSLSKTSLYFTNLSNAFGS